MLNVRFEGDRAVIEGLNELAGKGIPQAITKGLTRAAIGIYDGANEWLRGKGGASKKVRKDYVGFTKKSGETVNFRSYTGAGAYPVPVRTGHLRRSLDWLKPGATKSSTRKGEQHDVGTFTAGPNEVVVYNAAEYADVIHEGKGSSAKFRPRRFLTDAFEKFNHGDRIKGILEEEIGKAINANGKI